MYNVPQFIAVALSYRLEKWTWNNWRYKFRPPVMKSVQLWPHQDATFEDGYENPFDHRMFHIGGSLHDKPLNHYIVMETAKGKRISVNAGHLAQYFLVSERAGYAELSRIINNYELPPTPQVVKTVNNDDYNDDLREG